MSEKLTEWPSSDHQVGLFSVLLLFSEVSVHCLFMIESRVQESLSLILTLILMSLMIL